METCPRCEATREGGRFCTACGFDFWKDAAGDEQAEVPASDVPPQVEASRLRTGGTFVVAGLGLLLVAGVAAFFLLPDDELPPGETAATRRPLSEEEEVIHAFFRQARDPHAAFSLDESCSLALRGETSLRLEWATDAQIHGDDWFATMVIAADPQAGIRVDAAFVDGTTYLRQADQAWQSAELPRSVLGPASPFAWISSVVELEYVGREQGGRTVHLLMTEKWMPIEIDSVLPVPEANLTDRQSRMRIYVEDDSVPIAALHTLSAAVADPAGGGAIEASCAYSFADWNAVEPIEPPIPGTTPVSEENQPTAALPASRG